MATGIENLKVYTMAKELELKIHFATKEFPKEEKFRSIDQLNRSSSSVTNNVAEAYYKQSVKEKIHILRDIAITEAEETRTNLLRCAEKGFISKEKAEQISEEYITLRKALFGYIRFLQGFNEKKLINSSTVGRRP